MAKKTTKKNTVKKYGGAIIERPMDVLMLALREVEAENIDQLMKAQKIGGSTGTKMHQKIIKEIEKRTKGKFDPDFVQAVVEVQYPHNW